MNPGKPLRRKTALKRTEFMRRTDALTRAAEPEPRDTARKPRKRSPRPRKQQVRVPPTWQAAVFGMHGGQCWVTHLPATEAHHIIKAQVLRRELAAIVTRDQLARILGDPRNGLPLSDQPHDDHHAITITDKRLTREQLPWQVFDFARELDALVGHPRFSAWLERFYPSPTKPKGWIT